MMTVAFDGRMGASGDMILGALLAAGADPDVLEPIATAIDVAFATDRTVVQGIESTDVTVRSTTADRHDHDHDHGHHNDHDHDHDHDHGHHNHAEGHGPHRSYPEVVSIVEGMELPASVTDRALAAFRLLGEAESAVHGTDLEETHFHEVGADDAIADVTGAALLLDDLGAEDIVVGPLSVGDGEVDTSHGTYPVPPPAVAEILGRSSLSWRGGPVAAELVTPTGAAILGAVGTGVEVLPPMVTTGVGYGAGTKRFPNRPNVLRAFVGTRTGTLGREPIRVLETTVDDVTPEVLGHLQTALREVGAVDVSIAPMTMKKARPGHHVRVIVHPADEARVARRLAAETGTLGVRSSPTSHRWIADRTIETVTIAINGTEYDGDVKVATDEDGTVLDRSAEFDDAARIAQATGLPVRTVLERLEDAAETR